MSRGSRPRRTPPRRPRPGLARWLGWGGVALALAGCAAVESLRGRETPAALVGRGDGLVAAGDYRQAHDAYARAVATGAPGHPPVDRALLGLARLYLLPENPARDPERAGEYLDRLVAEHPRSPLLPEARAWQALLQTLRAREEALAAARQELERWRGEAVEARRQAREASQAAQRTRQELDRLRADLLRARQDLERLRQDLDRLRQLELQLERRR